jgi:type IV secretion system protein VirB4
VKLRDWLKTLRKKNARVVFATQSLSDLYNPATKNLTQVTAAIMESCPTKIYLPNSHMDSEMKTLYQKMGLTDRQIEIIQQESIPKHHYYVVTPDGNRLIDLSLQPNSKAMAFIGLSNQHSQALIACQNQHGDAWLNHWLNESTEITEASCIAH